MAGAHSLRVTGWVTLPTTDGPTPGLIAALSDRRDVIDLARVQAHDGADDADIAAFPEIGPSGNRQIRIEVEFRAPAHCAFALVLPRDYYLEFLEAAARAEAFAIIPDAAAPTEYLESALWVAIEPAGLLRAMAAVGP